MAILTSKISHSLKYEYIEVMKILIECLYDATVNAKVPSFKQKCNSMCLRSLKLRFMLKNGQKLPFSTSLEGPLVGVKILLTQNSFESCS